MHGVHMDKQVLLNDLDKLHTTEMGLERIRRNLALGDVDVVDWCRSRIMSEQAKIDCQGKNWYICVDGCIITVNIGSYTIITAHREKKEK
ncbi:MAG: DUF3781 domain-containing protein [Lachnospiraceae bacterium]|nr:DUF3781 domain-containing protein [Lachnospiraceae bacterium]